MTDSSTPKQRPSSSRKYWRVALRVVLGLLLLMACGGLIISLRIHRSNASENQALFPREAAPVPHERILIFSPHCDDETLGAGGFIHAAVKAGANVHVVMMTNGDGFELAAALHYRKLHMTGALLRRFALERQQEAIAADGALGLQPDQITFLGFPDTGLATLWRQDWTSQHLYYSRYTHTDHNPYVRTLHPGQAYCGAQVLDDVEECIKQFHPDLILTTHPNDDHPDHWATGTFVRAALADLSRQGVPWISHIRFQFFIVHHGDWPVPQGYHPNFRLVPPFSLVHTDTRWSEFPLSAQDEAAKKNAVEEYRSQTAVLGRFMSSFIRSSECFGSIRPARLAPGLPSTDRVLVLRGPVDDTLVHTIEQGANIQAIDARLHDNDVCFRVLVQTHTSPRVAYHFYLQSIRRGDATTRQWSAIVRGHKFMTNIPNAQAWLSKAGMEVHIPSVDFKDHTDWFVSADTRIPGMILDHAGWREVHIAPNNT